MSTFNIDTSTSRATPSPVPGKRMTAPAIRARKIDGKSEQPIVMLTAYTMRMAQLLDPHCDMLLVGDSLGQVIYGLPSTIPVTMEMMCAHGAAVVRLPGTGDGVARLVEVSMVKVDMRAPYRRESAAASPAATTGRRQRLHLTRLRSSKRAFARSVGLPTILKGIEMKFTHLALAGVSLALGSAVSAQPTETAPATPATPAAPATPATPATPADPSTGTAATPAAPATPATAATPATPAGSAGSAGSADAATTGKARKSRAKAPPTTDDGTAATPGAEKATKPKPK
jgi:hypothetical protein